jgi:hypothetical protein
MLQLFGIALPTSAQPVGREVGTTLAHRMAAAAMGTHGCSVARSFPLAAGGRRRARHRVGAEHEKAVGGTVCIAGRPAAAAHRTARSP